MNKDLLLSLAGIEAESPQPEERRRGLAANSPEPMFNKVIPLLLLIQNKIPIKDLKKKIN
jgi:hypothetical protein